MMGKGYVSQLEYDIILELYPKYSRGTSKMGKGPRDILARMGKIVGSGVMREKIRNMLEYFDTDILSSMRSQLDTLQIRKKREETKQALAIFCLRCRTKHPRRECLLDQI
jgi:hypothetical protein